MNDRLEEKVKNKVKNGKKKVLWGECYRRRREFVGGIGFVLGKRIRKSF